MFGTNTEDVVDYVANHGVVDECAYPFSFYLYYLYIPDFPLYNPTKFVKTTGYAPVPSMNKNVIKRFMINKGPLVSGYKATQYNHAMTLVGYFDINENADSLLSYTYGNGFTLENPIDPNYYGETCWIFKNSYGENNYNGVSHSPYMYIMFNNDDDMLQPYYFHSPVNIIEFEDGDTIKVYNSSDIVIEDNDGDGYYNWGIGPRPSNMPEYAQLHPDGDDSNPLIGGMNQYGYCLNLNPDEREIEYCIYWECDLHHGYNHIVLEDTEEYLYEDVYFHNGARITIKNGGLLYVENGCNLYDVEIIMEPGGKLVIREGATIHLRRGVDFSAPVGAIVEIINGRILNYSE